MLRVAIDSHDMNALQHFSQKSALAGCLFFSVSAAPPFRSLKAFSAALRDLRGQRVGDEAAERPEQRALQQA